MPQGIDRRYSRKFFPGNTFHQKESALHRVQRVESRFDEERDQRPHSTAVVLQNFPVCMFVNPVIGPLIVRQITFPKHFHAGYDRFLYPLHQQSLFGAPDPGYSGQTGESEHFQIQYALQTENRIYASSVSAEYKASRLQTASGKFGLFRKLYCPVYRFLGCLLFYFRFPKKIWMYSCSIPDAAVSAIKKRTKKSEKPIQVFSDF